MKGEPGMDAAGLTSAHRPSSVLILGLGNPILGDDGAGWQVAEAVSKQLGEEREDVEVDCASLGGLSLMERMLGYERVILIDAIETGLNPVGHTSRFPLEALSNPSAGHSASAHDASLLTALQSAKALGQIVPRSVEIVAIETRQTYEFSEKLSPAVAAAVEVATRKVLEAVRA